MDQLPYSRNQRPVAPRGGAQPFCDNRKKPSFSAQQWWSIALSINFLIVFLSMVIRTRGIPTFSPLASSETGTVWLLMGALALSLLLPTMCFYQIHRILWLQKHGVKGSGRVRGHRQIFTRRGRRLTRSLVEFRPKMEASICQVEMWGKEPMHRKVQVLYDPANPNGCALVLPWISDFIFYTALCLIFTALAVFVVVGLLLSSAIP